MYLKNLKLYNFRSYETLDLDFQKEINVICGKNAQGKTNIVEAINYFSSLKSHRSVTDKELILDTKDQAIMKIEFECCNYVKDMKICLYESAKRETLLNNIKTERTSFLGNFYSVLFSPEDLNLIKGEKELRRRFMDTDICQIRPMYYKIIKSYNSILLSRNKILKNNHMNSDGKLLLDVYSKKLIDYGTEVILYRSLYIARLKETAKKIYKEISNDNRELKIVYKTSFEIENTEDKKKIKEDFKNMLILSQKEEQIKQNTQIGPHRDDVEFLLDDKNAKVYASQGQMRTIVLALKLSELIFIKEITNESPILLLDDILSELDRERQKRLFYYVSDFQTIITVTDANLINKNKVNFIEIENSKVIW